MNKFRIEVEQQQSKPRCTHCGSGPQYREVTYLYPIECCGCDGEYTCKIEMNRETAIEVIRQLSEFFNLELTATKR